jgi:glycosyltransferase involved in cell wall biosynthesis
VTSPTLQPLVSILTPSLDQGRWLPRNLASVADQTYPRIEHIVMDGGSTDETVEILDAAPNLRWRSEPDRGQSHALNKALAESTGDIIGWLNADDAYFGPEAVATAVAAFAAHPTSAVVYGHAVLVDSDDTILHFLWVPPYNRVLLGRYNYIFQPSAFIRRSAVADVFVDEEYDSWMDRELWLRLSATHVFQRVDAVLAADRHHDRRKSYRGDLADADRRRLVARYGKSAGLSEGIEQRALRVIMRFAGASLVLQARSSANAAFELDSRWNLLLRQLAMTRRESVGEILKAAFGVSDRRKRL